MDRKFQFTIAKVCRLSKYKHLDYLDINEKAYKKLKLL